MSDNPSDEQRWIPSNEELPGGKSTPSEGIPGTDEGQTDWGAPESPGQAQTAAGQPGFYPAGGGGQESSGKSVAALVSGILGLTLCPILIPSIAAVVLGYSARNEIDASGGRIGNRGLAIAGIILGWIGIAFFVLGILLVIVLVIIGAAVDDSDIFDITTTTSSVVYLLG